MSSSINNIFPFGSVKEVALPPGWTYNFDEQPGGRTLVSYRYPGNPDIRLCFYFRDVPLSMPEVEAFQSILYGEFHYLNSDEVSSIAPVLEGMSNPAGFVIDSIQTNYLNDRRSVQVVGNRLATKERTAAVFINPDGNGRIVHQFYFTAPAELFDLHLPIANVTFTSIVWQPEDQRQQISDLLDRRREVEKALAAYAEVSTAPPADVVSEHEYIVARLQQLRGSK